MYYLRNDFVFLQRSLQYFTSSQTFSHFLRHVKGRLQALQILTGKFSFFITFIKSTNYIAW
jgi:hypothetical protein